MEYRVLLRATYRFGSFSSPRTILSALLLAWMAHVNPCDAQTCGQLSGVNFTENFNSLPGTILQIDINEGERVITAIKIEGRPLKKNEMKIPSSGQRISQKALSKMMDEQRDRMRANGGGGVMIRD